MSRQIRGFLRGLGLCCCLALVVCRESPRPSESPRAEASVTDGGAGGDGGVGETEGSPVLIFDFAQGPYRLFESDISPDGLVAFRRERSVEVWSLEARAFAGAILLDEAANERGRTASRVESVAFLDGDRLAVGHSTGFEIVDLRDTGSRRRRGGFRVSVVALEGTEDGLVAGLSSGVINRYSGEALNKGTFWTLPSDAGRISSIEAAGDWFIVTTSSELFRIGRGIREVPVPRLEGDPEHVYAASPGRSGELIVAGPSKLSRLSLETLEPLGEVTSRRESVFGTSLRCDAEAGRCYWSRGGHLEVWRDDLSSRIAEAQVSGLIEPRSGRVLRPATGDATLRSFRDTIFEVAESFDGELRPMGATVTTVRGALWSSREGELLLDTRGGALALRLSDLSIRALEGAYGPLAVGSDGRVLASGPLSETIVFSPDLAPERRVSPPGCQAEKGTEMPRQLERRCERLKSFVVTPSHRGTLLAMDSDNGEVRILDYSTGRWLETFHGVFEPDLNGVANFAWSPGNEELKVQVNRQLSSLRREGLKNTGVAVSSGLRGIASNEEGDLAMVNYRDELILRSTEGDSTLQLPFEAGFLAPGPGGRWVVVGEQVAAIIEGGAIVARQGIEPGSGEVDVLWSGPQPILASPRADGGLLLTRLLDGRQLTITVVGYQGCQFAIARAGERYLAFGAAGELVHLRRGATDLLAPTTSAEAAREPALVQTFLSGR